MILIYTTMGLGSLRQFMSKPKLAAKSNLARASASSNLALASSAPDIAASTSTLASTAAETAAAAGGSSIASGLRYLGLGIIGMDEYIKSRYSGDSTSEALSNAINKGIMTSMLLPNKSKLQNPGTKADVPKKMAVAAASMN